MKETGHYIHGELIQGKPEKSFENKNPATGEVLCQVHVASQSDVDKAIQSAKEGFLKWSKMPARQRGQILMKASQVLRERNDELAHLEVLDTGKPISEAQCVDVTTGADAIEYYAGLAASLHGEHHDFGNAFAYTRREPLGICAGIGAWNYPLQIACWKSAPALACGNVMIFKPAELTPMTALKLAEIYSEAGVPDGVFNVIQGDAEVGTMLTSHPDIAKVSLTGEVGTGKKVMAACAETLKYVTLELGGKSPLLIFEDADVEQAVSAAMMANFYTQGEICSNGTRVYVHKSIKEKFLNRLLARTKKMIVGDPLDPQTQVGALISKEHYKKVLSYIEIGQKEGAKLLCGGAVNPEDLPEKNKNGFFVAPAIFDATCDALRIVREEIFGPVLTLLTFQEEKEVTQRANETSYGLAAGVFTKDLQRAHRVAAELQAGICWINNYNITPVEVPFGGYKQSGLGRENGLVTIEHYTQLKTVYVEMGEVDCPYA